MSLNMRKSNKLTTLMTHLSLIKKLVWAKETLPVFHTELGSSKKIGKDF